MVVTYRQASKDDLEGIYDFTMKAISDSILPKFAENAAVDLQDRIYHGDSVTIIAVDDSEIVAYTELDFSLLESKNSVYIIGVYVLPSHRRQGIGAKLLQIVKADYCNSGERLRVQAYTTEGRDFWISLNFHVGKYIMEFSD